MKSSWTNGLSAEKKAEITAAFNYSGIIRKRLSEILNKKQESVRQERLKDSGYSDANWAYKQADAVGYQRAIEEILQIILD